MAKPSDGYKIDALRERFANGYRPRFIYFWKPTVKRGNISPACFSQWYLSPFTIDGVEYKTTEHWMMASKARLFGDVQSERRILQTESPATVKKMGRQVKNFDEDVWLRERYNIVLKGNVAKFDQHPTLKENLLATGDSVIVEASPFDRIWGIGMKEGDEGIDDPRQWKGLNLLGFAIMDAREELQRRSAQGQST